MLGTIVLARMPRIGLIGQTMALAGIVLRKPLKRGLSTYIPQVDK